MESADLKEADALAIAVNLPQLTTLNLRANSVGDAGAKAIAENLTQLISFNLWNNSVSASAELREDRDAFDLYFRQQNDRLRKEGLYLEIVRWENFLDAMSETRLQDEYNRKVRACDVFVSLFMTKTGKYTQEEFDVAHQAFLQHGKPLIYTFFKDAQVSADASNRDDLLSLWNFQEKLRKLGHFFTQYKGEDDLKLRFKDQLEKLRDAGSL